MEQDKNSLAADIARMTSTPEGETVPPSHSMTFGAAFKDLVQGAKQRELWLDEEGEAEIERVQCMPGHLMPEDLARAALFLAADDSRMCTGQNWLVDGGWA